MRWVEAADADQSVYAFVRLDPTNQGRPVLVVVNATPVPRHNYRLGVPVDGEWVELLNTDADAYGGSGVGNGGSVHTVPVDSHGFNRSIMLTVPPLGALLLAPEQAEAA
jgi:1,4-alpha-glucan branching enzyme